MHFYTADTHFNHKNIIKYCNRPFSDVEEMNQTMIVNFQAQIKDHDHLWIVGDFGFGNAERLSEIFNQIPEKKHLIIGNHDYNPVFRLNWESIRDVCKVGDGVSRFFLNHYPMLTWEGIGRGVIQLFGHVHENWAGSSNSINVGVDLWGFKACSRQEIINRASTLTSLPYLSKLEPQMTQDIRDKTLRDFPKS